MERLIQDEKEAIETIKLNMPTSGYQMLRESLDMAMKALEKQIPKKSTDFDENLGYFECPSCGELIYATDDFESHKYCLNCGQRLWWEEK